MPEQRDVHRRFARWVEWVGSQAKAAERIGTHQTQVSRWCRGARDPGLHDAAKIAEATKDWPEGPIAVTAWAAPAEARTGTDD